MIQALQILKSSNYPDADKTLNKVAGLFSHNMQSEWLEIDFSYWGSPEKERVNITALERAIINKYVITFTYFNTELTVTAQTVEPLKLVLNHMPGILLPGLFIKMTFVLIKCPVSENFRLQTSCLNANCRRIFPYACVQRRIQYTAIQITLF